MSSFCGLYHLEHSACTTISCTCDRQESDLSQSASCYIGSRGRLILIAEDMSERHTSLPKPFASGDANEWFQRFDICSRANGWEDATKALKLPTLLEGEALASWMELTDEQQGSYEEAKKRLLETMMPIEFVSLDDFHHRKLPPGEALSVFVHDMKK